LAIINWKVQYSTHLPYTNYKLEGTVFRTSAYTKLTFLLLIAIMMSSLVVV